LKSKVIKDFLVSPKQAFYSINDIINDSRKFYKRRSGGVPSTDLTNSPTR
jgi:hypothetical protein